MDKKTFDIEIPLGAHDSEMMGWEYTIPAGYTAEIKDGKVIIKKNKYTDEQLSQAVHNCLEELEKVHGWNYVYVDDKSIPISKIKEWNKDGRKKQRVTDIEDKFSTEFEKQVSHILASVLNGEWDYDEGFVRYVATNLLGYAKNELEKPQKEEKWNEEDEKIRKILIESFEKANCSKVDEFVNCKLNKGEILAYLERQKEGNLVDKKYVQEAFNKGMQTGMMQKPAEWGEDTIRKAIEEVGLTQYQINWFKNNVFPPKQEWSKEEKERIRQNGRLDVCYNPEKYGLCHKTEWGEGEMEMLVSIINDYEMAAKSFCGHDGKIMFLKAIRDGEYGLSKQGWSEEDMMYLSQAIETLEHENYIILADKLKSLRPQPKQGWSEEDDAAHTRILGAVAKAFMGVSPTKPLEEDVYWFKSLPERFNLQPRVEWSEEDEKFINSLCVLFPSIAKNNYVGGYYAPDLVSRLKSLHPSWKPSEEQMDYLAKAIDTLSNEGDCKTAYHLNEIRKGLKKLI